MLATVIEDVYCLSWLIIDRVDWITDGDNNRIELCPLQENPND